MNNFSQEAVLNVLADGKEYTTEEIAIYTDMDEGFIIGLIPIMSTNNPIKFNDVGLKRKFYLDKPEFHEVLQTLPQNSISMIKAFIKRHGECTTNDVSQAFKISHERANVILTKVSMRCNNIKKSITLTFTNK